VYHQHRLIVIQTIDDEDLYFGNYIIYQVINDLIDIQANYSLKINDELQAMLIISLREQNENTGIKTTRISF